MCSAREWDVGVICQRTWSTPIHQTGDLQGRLGMAMLVTRWCCMLAVMPFLLPNPAIMSLILHALAHALLPDV